MSSGYINSFRAMRMNFREEKFKEGKLRELQMQEDKTMGIWAKKQLRIEQQIATKQSPLQRARRIRNKRQEEINRIHRSIANGGTEHKTSEKRLSKRLNSCHSERELETRLVKSSLALPGDILRSSSSISLPSVPAKKEIYVRRNSLPLIPHSPPTVPLYKKKTSSLPAIGGNQPLHHQKLPPLTATVGLGKVAGYIKTTIQH